MLSNMRDLLETRPCSLASLVCWAKTNKRLEMGKSMNKVLFKLTSNSLVAVVVDSNKLRALVPWDQQLQCRLSRCSLVDRAEVPRVATARTLSLAWLWARLASSLISKLLKVMLIVELARNLLSRKLERWHSRCICNHKGEAPLA